ncbi:MAG: class I SAM-dependent methyltransferase [Geminicoccaceae bacterium]|nr:class I SAM-dependent methyltransferase [Geminicoccaceae bacterium]
MSSDDPTGGVRKTVRRWLGGDEKKRAVDELYAGNDFLEAYARHTDLRVEADRKEAIGGLWDEMGRHQFEFLKLHGLEPFHTLLDIGCGTLRGGRHFIPYLEAGHYTGFDISPRAIEAARELVRAEGLEDKRPDILLDHAKRLDFALLGGRRFNFVLAQSVFSHLLEEHIEEAFANIHKALTRDGYFFFTFRPAEEGVEGGRVVRGKKDFAYPVSYFEDVAHRHGLDVENLSEAYAHPHGQAMMLARPHLAERQTAAAG